MKWREFERLLKSQGYQLVRTSGSHGIYVKDGKHVSIPRGRDVNRMLARRLMKEMGLSV
jgi:predicted RNA binding protein YcfA (HicA-like mRNA interferase family)